MSLTYVTKKLEDQTLEEGELGSQKVCQVEDSGTESDDETDKEEGEEDEEGDLNLDSGVSLNLRSGADRAHRGRSRQLPTMNRLGSGGGQTSLPTLAGCLDDNDNHSSEEELEDIIGSGGKKVVYGVSSIKTGSSSSSSTNTEKRKWSEVNSSSGDEAGRTSQCVFRAGSGSSGDEEVSGLMLSGGTGSSYTPVQFCTSPPLDVYKPRKSQSPPPKLFHMAAQSGPPRQHSLDGARGGREGQRPSGAFLPRRLLRPVEYSSLPARQESGEGQEDGEPGEESGHRSPNKRHRSTPKPQNIQRPCLDFEKMQQIKTKVVTSWRQGTELSLFCW